MTSALSRLQRSSGNKALLLRPIYLISKTPYEGVIHIPILSTLFFTPPIAFELYDGLIVTSKQTLKALESYPLIWKSLPIIAVSDKTAEVFEAAGSRVIATADGYGEGIGSIIERRFKEMRWLYLRPKIVASDWAQDAVHKGCNIREEIVYETQCNTSIGTMEIASDGVLIFTSPSSIKCFLQYQNFVSTQSIVVIGTTTLSVLPKNIIGHISPETTVASAVETARIIAQNSSPF